jgi:excisionase family DNA binding protein
MSFDSSNSNLVFLKKSQVAEMLRVSERTVEIWTHKGFLPSLKIGHTIRYDQAAVIQSLREMQNN